MKKFIFGIAAGALLAGVFMWPIVPTKEAVATRPDSFEKLCLEQAFSEQSQAYHWAYLWAECYGPLSHSSFVGGRRPGERD